jgi:hypothetical protein
MQSQGSSIADRVLLLVREASHRHRLIRDIFSMHSSFISKEASQPSHIQTSNAELIPPVSAPPMSETYDFDSIVKAFTSFQDTEPGFQGQELEALLASFLDDMPLNS